MEPLDGSFFNRPLGVKSKMKHRSSLDLSSKSFVCLCILTLFLGAPTFVHTSVAQTSKSTSRKAPTARRPLKLPPAFKEWTFPKLKEMKRKRREELRKRRKKRRRPPIFRVPTFKPSLAHDKRALRKIVQWLKKRDWHVQHSLIRQLSTLQGHTTSVLREALHDPHLRVRLLAARILAERKDLSAMPVLLKIAERLYDQPTPLLLGAWIAYGSLAERSILGAFKTLKHPHILLRALGFLRSSKGRTFLARYLCSPDPDLQKIAKEAVERYDVHDRVWIIRQTRAHRPTASMRSDFVRILSFSHTAPSFEMLIQYLSDSNSSIRFLARISLKTLIQQLHRTAPKRIPAPPQGRKAKIWKNWWKIHHQAVRKYLQKQRTKTQLVKIPLRDIRRVRIFYRTVHPIFGFGRMPLLIHHISWKKAPAPIGGKVWRVGLKTDEFKALLRSFKTYGFLKWTPQMGRMRDITVYTGTQSHRVTIGMTRHTPFERLERKLLQLAKRAKLGLHFKDFYNRRDEADIVLEDQVGLWAYTSRDRLPLRTWTPRKKWTPGAEIENTWSALRDTIRYIPSRTRIISLDVSHNRYRYVTLLYGPRVQSRLTRDGLLRARRFSSFKLRGLGLIYLSEDKIEQMHFDLKRSTLPHKSRSSLVTSKRISIFNMLTKVWDKRTSKIMEFRVKAGTPHRMFIRFRTRNARTLVQTLSRLALHSQGDRLLGLRINLSGAVDRATFKLVVQMQWEMMAPVPAPQRLPNTMQNVLHKRYQTFQPAYR